MNPTEREQLRLSLLRFLDAHAEVNAAQGLAESLLWQMARAEGRTTLSAAVLHGELIYLQDKQLITTVPKPLSPENRNWRLTARGRDEYALLGQQG